MSLVHLVVTKVPGYDLFTFFFDNRSENTKDKSSFIEFEKEFVLKPGFFHPHPEDNFEQRYYGYFIFPIFTADEIYNLYRSRCESKPNLTRRYNIYFDQEHVHLEEMIKKFDRPIEEFIKEKHKLKTYCHRIEYLERSIQILRDIQTAIYETETEIAAHELELHKRFLETLR
jgi:hypothetical protein